MYYDPEANKHGADYGPFDNTMAFSDVSIRAGKSPLTLSTSSTDSNYSRLILLLSGYVFSFLQDSSER